MPRVINQNRSMKHQEGVYIGRGSRWGNPFIMGIDGDRDEVCKLFEGYARWRLSIQHDWLYGLENRNLICHCAPKKCHGDILLNLITNGSNETWFDEEGEDALRR